MRPGALRRPRQLNAKRLIATKYSHYCWPPSYLELILVGALNVIIIVRALDHGRKRCFLRGVESFRPRPPNAWCAHAARDISRTVRGSHPPQTRHYTRKDPRTRLPALYSRRSG